MSTPLTEEIQRRLFRQVDRVMAALADLDEEAANWKPVPDANSVFVLAAHALAATERHVLEWAGGQKVEVNRAAIFASRGTAADLQARAEEVKSRVAAALAGLDDALLDQTRETLVGAQTARESLIHAVAHAAEHVGHAELTRDLAKARSS